MHLLSSVGSKALFQNSPQSKDTLREKLAQWSHDEPVEIDMEDIRFDLSGESGTSIVRTTTHRTTNIHMTPLILPVVNKLLAAVMDNVRNPAGPRIYADALSSATEY
jgi:hypothetical protein